MGKEKQSNKLDKGIMYSILTANKYNIDNPGTDSQGLWWEMETKANAVVHIQYKTHAQRTKKKKPSGVNIYVKSIKYCQTISAPILLEN